MVSLVERFMSLRERQLASASTPPQDSKELRKLLITIDPATGHTLLTWAISRRHEQLVELLVDSGADFRVANRFSKTALEVACSSGSIATVCRLLKDWSDRGVELRCEHLMSAMQCAVEANRPMVLAQLLSFFRDEFRHRQAALPEAAGRPAPAPLLPRPSAQDDAHAFFAGNQRSASPTLQAIMGRTTDTFLLTEKECSLLRLTELLDRARQAQRDKIVEIIHAHARLPRRG